MLFAPEAASCCPTAAPRCASPQGRVGDTLEGRIRPGHFDGVLTIVLKLLHVVGPDVVVFGQKDAQQVFLVRRMIRDLDVPVALEVVETVREDDGLARSSRNRYLDAGERRLARAVPAALDAAESYADRDVDAMAVRRRARSPGRTAPSSTTSRWSTRPRSGPWTTGIVAVPSCSSPPGSAERV